MTTRPPPPRRRRPRPTARPRRPTLPHRARRAPPGSAIPTSRTSATAGTTSSTTPSISRGGPTRACSTGVVTIEAGATQDLSRFNLDLAGMDVRSVTVDGEAAETSRADRELVITPAVAIAEGDDFTTVVTYTGQPEPVSEGTDLFDVGWQTDGREAFVVSRAVGCRHVLPGERPPHRQGHLHLPHHRSGGPGGGGQRVARVRERLRPWRPGLDLRGARPHGQLPGADRHRGLRAGRRW